MLHHAFTRRHYSNPSLVPRYVIDFPPVVTETNIHDGSMRNRVDPLWWEQAHDEGDRDYARRVCSWALAESLGKPNTLSYSVHCLCHTLESVLDTGGMQLHRRAGGWGGWSYTACSQKVCLINWPPEVPSPARPGFAMNGLKKAEVMRLQMCMFDDNLDSRPKFIIWPDGLCSFFGPDKQF